MILSYNYRDKARLLKWLHGRKLNTDSNSFAIGLLSKPNEYGLAVFINKLNIFKLINLLL